MKTLKLKAPPEPPERLVIKQIFAAARHAGWITIRLNSGCFKAGNRFIRAYQVLNTGESAGLPDLLLCKGQRMLFVEVKRVGGKIRESQQKFIHFAADFDVPVWIIDRWEDVLPLLGDGERSK